MPSTVTLSASPATVNAGASSTLTATATNATQVTITGSDGTTYTLGASGGTQAVTPTKTTTYTANATGSGGSTAATATATVTVTAVTAQSPTVGITANPTSIVVGGSSTLTVTATNATQVTITGSDGTTYSLGVSGGTQVVTPTTTTTYTASATGSGGSISATATVSVSAVVAPPPTVGITANPTSIVAGGSSILTVTATNATQVTITGTDKSTYTLQASGGIQAVSPAGTTTYTATATGVGGTITATAVVTVTANPVPTVTISATPASITSGSASTLTVSALNATTVTVAGSDGTAYTLLANGGTQSVSPTTTTTYTATATGPGGSTMAATTVTVTATPAPTVTITANPVTIITGNSSVLTVAATNATTVVITGSDNSSYSLPAAGGTQTVTPTATTTYTATATGTGAPASATVTVVVKPVGTVQSIDHVIFLLQENHSFDNYFGMLNNYRTTNKWTTGDDGSVYTVDGIDDKLKTISNKDDEGTSYPLFKFKTTCIDDESSAWLESYGDVNRYDFTTTRPINMDGFVHNAEGFATSCNQPGATCSGTFSDKTGERAMGYYDDTSLNYYYYMASQFALSDRWFSPVSSKSIDNRIATFTGGTTQGLTRDPADDKLGQLPIPTIFRELNVAKVSWKIYYTVTQGFCLTDDDCSGGANAKYPATDFSNLTDSYQYLNQPGNGAACTLPAQPSSVVGDTSNSFCIDPTHIAPISQYFLDLASGSLPSFTFIEAGYANNDEHPGSGQSILEGQAEVAKLINAFMGSPEWNDSVFFLSYDEGGGPYDHVPPVPGSSNKYTDAALAATIPDISGIAVNPDSYNPCVPTTSPSEHCDLEASDPGAHLNDAATHQGFAAQLGFRVPNMIISPFTRRHYVSHIPMDHTAVLKFVEDRFIVGAAHLTARDAAQPNLLDFFDFSNVPWATPPTPPTPTAVGGSCTPDSMGP